MQRRNFLKGACRICLLGAAGIAVADLSSCSPATGKAVYKPEVKGNAIEIPLSLFDSSPSQVISPKGFPFDIAVRKKENNNYQALLLSCTHYDNQLTVTGTGYTCSVHGSRFNADGNVEKGPAARPLKQLPTSINNNTLLIQLIN